MKKINDSDIKKLFNDSSRYEIKLSSEDITKNVLILNEEKPVKKKKTILFPLLISLNVSSPNIWRIKILNLISFKISLIFETNIVSWILLSSKLISSSLRVSIRLFFLK